MCISLGYPEKNRGDRTEGEREVGGERKRENKRQTQRRWGVRDSE